MPLVTVIIPTYRREVKYLSRAIKSILEQTYKNIEIIVIDDSPDSYEYRNDIRIYMESIESERILYYQNDRNTGGALARNRGISLANGSFTTFLDDDDEYKSEKIEMQVKFMVDGEFDLSFSDMIMYNTKDRKSVV